MKKWIFALSLALIVGFTSAVGLCVKTLFAPKTVAATENTLCIVLDAGHGGIDGGVVGRTSGVKESDLNLQITYCLKNKLEEVGFEVVLTRKTNAGLYGTTAKGFKKRDMQKRKEIIEKASPSLVISVHQNYYPSKSLRGGQVFYSQTNERSKKFALGLQESINEFYAEDGVKERSAALGKFFILDCCACPSVIVECGFLSNAKDEALLLDKKKQGELASALTVGVLAYFSA